MNTKIGDFGEEAVLKELTSERYGYHACHFYTHGRQGIDIVAWKSFNGSSRWYDRPDHLRFIEVKSTASDGKGNPQSLLRDFQKFGGHDFVAERLWAVGWESKHNHIKEPDAEPAKVELAEFREVTGGSGSCVAAQSRSVNKRKLANKILSWFHGSEFSDGAHSWVPCTNADIEEMIGLRSASSSSSRGLRNPIHSTFELVYVPKVDLAHGTTGAIRYHLPWSNRARG